MVPAFLVIVLWSVIRPQPVSGLPAAPRKNFSHEDLDRVLHQFVNDEGMVNYRALKQDSVVFGDEQWPERNASYWRVATAASVFGL
jgi:hypothetical protein